MDAPQFTEALVALLPRLRRFACALASAQEADDLVQEACERALRAQDRFVPGTRLDSWMFRIVQNLWLDRCRRPGRASQQVALADSDLQEDGERQMMHSLDLARVRDRIARLPEDQRAVLALVTVEGLSYRDAAAVLDVPIGTVMSRLCRARQALMRLLEPDHAQA